jgi:hypothetical protein
MNEVGKSKQTPIIYKDTDGNYIYMTPVENLKGAAAALDDVEPEIANHPVVAHAKLLCSKALV